jgi:hypothetical protein
MGFSLFNIASSGTTCPSAGCTSTENANFSLLTILYSGSTLFH